MTLHLFLNAFLSIFESCFTIQTTTFKFNNNGWITADVRSLSAFSVGKLIVRYLKLFTHNTLPYREKHSEKLKERYYGNLIIPSTNKSKSLWKIITKEYWKMNNNEHVPQYLIVIILSFAQIKQLTCLVSIFLL